MTMDSLRSNGLTPTPVRGDLIDTPLGVMIALVDARGALQRL